MAGEMKAYPHPGLPQFYFEGESAVNAKKTKK
jgi:hypothetical protein